MKTITSITLTCCLAVFLTSATPVNNKIQQTVSVKANNTASFQRFIAHRQQNDVSLQWCMTTNAGVAGFIIERSYDGVYFDYLGETGVSNGAWTRYRDNAVFPGYVYYRIIAVMEDGSSTESDVEMVRIVRHG